LRATLHILLLCLFSSLISGIVSAQTVTWTNGGGDNVWSNPANWDGGVPTATDTVLFIAGNDGNSVLDADYSVETIKATSAYAGTLFLGGNTLTISGDADFSNMVNRPETGGTFKFTGSNAVFVPQSNQNIAGFEIEAGATVTINSDSWVPIHDSFTNNGSLVLNAVQLYIAQSATFDNNGVIDKGIDWGLVSFGGGAISNLGSMNALVRFRDVNQTIPAGDYNGGLVLETTNASAPRTYTLAAGTLNAAYILAEINSGHDYPLHIDASINNTTVNISGDFTTTSAGTEKVELSMGTGTWTVTDGSIDLSAVGTISAASATLAINNSTDETLALPSTLTNTTINKSGSGTLSITGGTSFTGTYNHSAGYSRIISTNALGTGTLILDGTGQILLGGNSIDLNNDFIINSCDVATGAAIQTQTDSWANIYGDITINAECANNHHFRTSAERLDLHGALNASGNTTIYFQAGTMELSGGGNATRMDMVEDGTIRVKAENGLPTGMHFRQMHPTNNTYLNLEGFDQTLASIASADNIGATILNSEPTTSTLTLNGTTDTIYQGEITGNLNLIKAGSYTQTLSGTNTYTGTTTLNDGDLRITGSLDSTSSVTINSGAVLSGSGTIAAPVTAENDAEISPGDGGVGALETGNLTLNGNTILTFELGTYSDTIVVNGDLILDGLPDIIPVAGFGAGDYTLFTYTGTLTNNGIAIQNFPANYSAEVVAESGKVILRVKAPISNQYVWINGTGANEWNINTNWDQGAAPGATDTVIFNNAFSDDSRLDADYSIGGIRTSTPYRGTLDLAGFTLTISGDADLSAMTQPPLTSGTFKFTGSGKSFRPQPSQELDILEITAGADITLYDMVLMGIKTSLINVGTLTLSSSQVYIDNGATLNNTGTIDAVGWGTISMSGGTITNLGTMNALVRYRDESQNVPAGDFTGGLRFTSQGSSGAVTYTLEAGTLNSGDIELENHSANDFSMTLDASTNNPDINITGNLYGDRQASADMQLNMGNGLWTIIDGSVDFSEITTINAGGGTLVFNNSSSETLTLANGHSLNVLNKTGTGRLTISGSSANSGITTINAGELKLSATLGVSSPITINSGATLLGNGTTGSSVSIQNGGIVSPGDASIDRLRTADLVLNPLSELYFEAGTTNDSIIVNGDLTLDGVLNITETAGFGTGSYTIMTYSGTLTDNDLTLGTFPVGYTGVIAATGGVVTLYVTQPAANSFIWTNFEADNNWGNPANWDQGLVPGATDTVIFTSAYNGNCILDGNYSIAEMKAISAYTGELDLNTNTLTISNNVDIESMTVRPTHSGTWRFTGSNSVFNTQKSMTIHSLEIPGGSQLTVTNDNWIEMNTLTNDGNLVLQNSQLSFRAGCTLANSGSIDPDGWGNISMAGGSITNLGTMNAYVVYRDLSQSVISGNFNGGLEFATYGASGPLTYTLPAGNINTPSLLLNVDSNQDFPLIIDGATNNPTLNISGDFTSARNGDSTIELSLGNDRWTIGGNADFSQVSNLDAGTGTLELNGNGTLSSNHSFYDLVVSGSYTTNGIISSLRHLIVSNTLTLGDDFIADGATDFTGGTINGTGALIVIASNTLSSAGTIDADVFFQELATQIVPARTYGGLVTIRTTDATTPRVVTFTAGDYTFNGGLRFSINASADFPLTIDASANNPDVSIASLFQTVNLGTETLVLHLGDGDWQVDDGNIEFANLDTLISGSGSFIVNNSIPVNLFTHGGINFPTLRKTGTGQLNLGTGNLFANSFSLEQGMLNFNGFDLTTSGNLTITNGTDSTVENLGGRTITVGGDASLTGQSGSMLNLNPTTSWFIVVSGTLDAYFSSIRNSTAGSSRGNADATCNNEGNNINWSFGTENPVLTLPMASGVDNVTLAYDFTLPENPLAGSVKMTFTQTGGVSDANSPHSITFTSALETSGNHTGYLDGANLSASPNVSSVNSEPSDFLVDGSLYTVTLEYRDIEGNLASSVNNTNFLYQTTGPAVLLSTMESDSTKSTSIPVTIQFASAVTGFTIDDISVTNASLSAFTNTIADSVWTVVVSPSFDGQVSIVIPDSVATDSLNNWNQISNTLSFYIDQTPPLLVELLLHSNRRISETNGPLHMVFDEAIQPGPGTMLVYQSSDSTLIDSITATSMEASQDTLSITLPFHLTEGESYFLVNASGFVSDDLGNTFTDSSFSGIDISFVVNSSPKWEHSNRNISVLDIPERTFFQHNLLNSDTLLLQKSNIVTFSQTFSDLENDGFTVQTLFQPDSSELSLLGDSIDFSWTSLNSGLDSLVLETTDSLGGTDTLRVYFFTGINESPSLQINHIWAWDAGGRKMRSGSLVNASMDSLTHLEVPFASRIIIEGELTDPENDQIFLLSDTSASDTRIQRTGNRIRIEFQPQSEEDSTIQFKISDSRTNQTDIVFLVSYSGSITSIESLYSANFRYKMIQGVLYFNLGEPGFYSMQLVGANGKVFYHQNTFLMSGNHSMDLWSLGADKNQPFWLILQKTARPTISIPFNGIQ